MTLTGETGVLEVKLAHKSAYLCDIAVRKIG
jgi:hypothetical protein